jgi:hypothetical protein
MTRRQHVESRQIETRPLGQSELDTVSGGRVCRQGPPRMEASVQLGTEVLVIWATSTCSGTYWYTK